MKQLYLWISIIIAIIMVVALQNRYRHVYVRHPHYEQQPLVHQFMAVLNTTKSTIPGSAYDDTTKPLFKELAYTIHSAHSRLTPLSLTTTGKHSTFLLKQTVPHLDAEQLTSWDLLPVPEKKELFAHAFEKALSDTDAVKKALITLVDTEALKVFIDSITSFTNQEYLASIYGQPEAQLLFTKNNVITLKPEILRQLSLANIPRATIPILNSIADQYNRIDEYILMVDGKQWPLMTLWFGNDAMNLIGQDLMRTALTRIYTLPTLKNWLRSPGLATKRLNPWYFLPTTMKKEFPQRGAPFTTASLNSAELTEPGTLFFRNEELLKNIVHELLHGLSIDKGIDVTSSSKTLSEHYAFERIDGGPLLLTEALVEALTHIIHTLYSASERPGSTFEGRLHNLWALEKSFAFYQSAKMLYFSKLDSLDEFTHPGDKKIQQTTAAVEYHLLKTALIYTPEKFLAIIVSPRNKQEKLLQLIHENLTDRGFIQELERFMAWLKKGNNLDPLFTTGRMTVVE